MGSTTLSAVIPDRVAILIRKSLDIDAKKASTREIAAAADKLSRNRRLKLLSTMDTILQGPSRRLQSDRIVAAKMLVSLLPDSISNIERWLNKKKDQFSYELHFSLFCYIDDSLAFSLKPDVIGKLHQLTTSYLARADRGTAQAAWMAANMLGEHWPGQTSLETLASIATTGRHVEGRKAALWGLQRRREVGNASDQLKVREMLKVVISSDRSMRLRRLARWMLEKAD